LAAAPRPTTTHCPPPPPPPSPPPPVPQLGQHLSRAEQRALLHRRDYVLRYLDDLVARQGYAATVRE
jgi:hypothetical protein